jgi:hypothetical protein
VNFWEFDYKLLLIPFNSSDDLTMMPSDGILAFDEQMAVQRANHIPESPLIDLTSDDPPLPRLIGPSEEDADLAKALALSVESSGLAVTRFSAQDEDAEYTKAMEASLVSLQAEEVGNGWDVGPSFVRGEERVRDDMRYVCTGGSRRTQLMGVQQLPSHPSLALTSPLWVLGVPAVPVCCSKLEE